MESKAKPADVYGSPGSANKERRRGSRYPIMATAEVTEPRSLARINGRSTDISLGGCYVDTLNSLPSGTVVGIHLTQGDRSFEAQAKVVHSQPGMGMGLIFTQIKPDQKAVLREWVAELSGESSSPLDGLEAGSSALQVQTVLQGLIELLIRKGVLTRAEGEALQRGLLR